jgi:hypothetical protein
MNKTRIFTILIFSIIVPLLITFFINRDYIFNDKAFVANDFLIATADRNNGGIRSYVNIKPTSLSERLFYDFGILFIICSVFTLSFLKISAFVKNRK